MPISVKIDNIPQMLSTIKALTDEDKIAEVLANKGAEFAREEYGRRKVAVSTEKVSKGVYKVVAEGRNVAFEEFGTGIYARGSYAAETEGEGILPTQPITFRSRSGEVHTTMGWEYYYPSRHKDLVNGKYGWWMGRKLFLTGNRAKAHLWKAGKRLRGELRTINLAKLLNGGESDV